MKRSRSHALAAGLVLLLAITGLGAFCPADARGPESARDAPLDIARLSADLSEPGGYFDTDNLISNETSYLQVADQLASTAPRDGVYLGVGPDQNFSLMARVRPRYAFILDIRRQNLLQHLFFASLFARADDPYQYLCRLFSRPCPAVTPAGAVGGGVEKTLEAVEEVPKTEATYTANLDAAYEHIEGALRYPLRAGDRAHIRKIARTFYDEQSGIRFETFGRPGATYHPTYRRLLLLRSPSGRYGSFLDSADDYAFVRDLSRGRRLVPVVGDFAGPRAIKSIGQWVRERGLVVSAFYTSNVEYYLVRNGVLDKFVASVRALPRTSDSLIVRACFTYGRPHPAELPGHRSVMLLQRMPRFLELYDAGTYTGDWELCTADYVR